MCKNSRPIPWDPSKATVDTNYAFLRPVKKLAYKVHRKTKEESPKGKSMTFEDGIFLGIVENKHKFMGRGRHVFYL